MFVMWHDNPQVGNSTHGKLYDHDFRNGQLPVDARISGTDRNTSAVTGIVHHTHSATGRFKVGAREQVVAIWGGGPSGIHIMIPDFDTTAAGWSNATGAIITGQIQNDRIHVHTLDADGDGLDEFIVAYMDNSDSIRFLLYDVDSLLQPSLITEYSDRRAISSQTGRVRYSVTTGDFNGDGTDEVALLRADGASGFFYEATLQIYDIDDGTMISKGSAQVSTGFNAPLQQFEMCAVAGEFIPGGGKEIAICMSLFHGTSFRKVQAEVVTLSTDLMTIGQGNYFTPTFSQGSITLGASVGDLIGDERDELVVLAGTTAFIMTMTTGDSLNVLPAFQVLPSQYAYGNDITRAMHDHVKITDVDQDGAKDIVVVYDRIGSGDGGINIRVFGVDTAGVASLKGELLHDEADPIPGSDPPLYEFRPYTFAVGNFDGLNFTIGQPEHHVLQGVAQPIVMLNAPPVHFDMLNGTVYDVNQCFNNGSCDFGATYRKQTTTSIEVSTTVQSDWLVSSGLSLSGSVSLGATVEGAPLGVGGSVTAEVSVNYEHRMLAIYGENFSNTGSSGTTLTIGVEVTAREDDRLYSTVTDYDVWEYPLYHGNEPFPRSTILTFVPLNVQATWFPSKSYAATAHVPDHEVGNVLSYPAYVQLEQNPNLDQAIAADYNNDSFVLDASSNYDWYLSMVNFESSSADTSRVVGMDVGLGMGPIRFDGNYSDKQLRSHTVSVTDQIDLQVHLGSVDMSIGDAKYTVTPYAYWDKNGALVVDYAAKPEIAPPGFPQTWWQQQYSGKPDPTFVLPWRLDPEKGFAISEPAKRKQTKDIFFSPNHVRTGDTMTVTARVRNFSLLGTQQPVTAHFYLGDPEAGGEPMVGLHGSNEVVTSGPIPAQGRLDVELLWVIPDDLSTFPRIYVVLDEDGAIDEIHEDNNTGFNVMWFSGTTDITEMQEVVVSSFLGNCYPNPVDASTTIPFELNGMGRATLTLFDQMGRRVAVLMDEVQPPGNYQVTFDVNGLAGGLYYYSLHFGDLRETRKMVVLK